MAASPPGFELAPLNPRAGDVPAVGRQRSAGPELMPSDSKYGSLWGMDKIQAPLAWDTTTGGTGLLVADIDSGMDYTHPDLYLNVWLNQGEIPSAIKAGLQESPADGDDLITFFDLNVRDAGGSFVNAAFVQDLNGNGYVDAGDLLNDSRWEDGVDNDGNVSNGRVYVDDLVGWNFTTNTNDPMDGGTANQGHGTHTAGTIGAIGNNGSGVVGVNWTTQMMSLKIFGDNGSGIVDTAIADAIYYSADNGARVSNNSWGGTGGTVGDALYTAINYAGTQKNQLFVAAAGNGNWFGIGINNDTSSSRVFPASYNLPNIISVAATDSNDALASFSNYGATTVDLAGPGVGVLSTVPLAVNSSGYLSHSGTSMATPHVSGVAALAWGLLGSGTSYATIRDAVLKSVDAVSSLAGKVVTGGRLNAAKTLQEVNPTPPSAPTSLAATAVSSSRIDLAWTDTSTNENGFRIERWDGTTFIAVGTAAANQTSYADTGLVAGTTYTYRVVAYNNHPQTGISNEASETTQLAGFVAAPSELNASAASSTQINLSWRDNSDNENGFSIERFNGTAFVQIATVAANTTTFQNTGLTTSTAYIYRVRAAGASGSYSAYSNEVTGVTAGNGVGLTGRYYASSTFTNLKKTRTDAAVNFNWGTGRPVNGMPTDNFTVRWVGQVQPTKTEGYTFYAKVDDNVRLWINGELVLRRWGSANTSEYKTATAIQLEAGKKYNIQMDFREMTGGASAYLKWASASVAKQIIPQRQLYNTFAGAIASDSGTTTIGIDNGNGSSTTLAAPLPVPSRNSQGGMFSSTRVIERMSFGASDAWDETSADLLADASAGELDVLLP